MGEVFRARDPRLGRDVAIKILPPELSTSPDRLRRFEQEAQAAAALNHLNILAVYDVGAHDGQPYIVSELLEGDTLGDRLSSGALPARKAIDYAVQLARGLAAAHDKGIVHRDLKPQNVFVDSSGRVKILDFGLAKLTEREAAVASATLLPTQAPDTTPGVVLGTIGYMSPEQVRGQTADHRADIFALGTVLYEMLSGQRAFRRETAIDTMTAILKEDPPDLPVADKRIPAALVRIVDRCIDKNPSSRFQSAGDLAFALEALTSSSGEAHMVTERGPAPARFAWAVAATALLAALASAGVAATMYFVRAPAEAPTLRYSVLPPEGWRLSLLTRPGAPTPIVLAPNGRSLAFVARRSTDSIDTVWIQPLDSLTPHPLAGTEGVSSMFWSPDSRFIGFFAANKLKKIEAAGGPPTIVSDAPGAAGGTWSDSGVIIFNGGVTSLKKVAASGGVATDATTLGPGEQAHFRPSLLPDGRHFLFTVYTGALGVPSARLPIHVGSIDSSQHVKVGESSSTNVLYAQGHLLFARDTTLMAQPFDLTRLATSGEAMVLAEGVRSQGAEPHQSVFSVSANGVLAYLTSTARSMSQLTWVTREGKLLTAVGDRAQYTEVSLSPDEKRVASTVALADLWTLDVARGIRSRITFDETLHASPVWSPDGERIAYSRGAAGVFQRPSNGTGKEELLFPLAQAALPTDWSRDGRYLLMAVLEAARVGGNVAVGIVEGRKVVPLLTTPFNEMNAKFSPDMRWIAYTSDESGRSEVYVVPFKAGQGPDGQPGIGDGKWQISTGGGTLPRWRRDGKELFYFDEVNGKLMGVPVNANGLSLEVSAGQPLFPIRPAGGTGLYALLERTFYDVAGDGRRFLVNAEPADGPTTATPVTVVVNWLPAQRR